jgi:26S proteasome regulatory subunit T5
MTTSPDVNYDELARSTDEFNGAQLKAVCVEAGMIALREGATKLGHEHFLGGIAEGKYLFLTVLCQMLTSGKVQSKKKNNLMYFA